MYSSIWLLSHEHIFFSVHFMKKTHSPHPNILQNYPFPLPLHLGAGGYIGNYRIRMLLSTYLVEELVFSIKALPQSSCFTRLFFPKFLLVSLLSL